MSGTTNKLPYIKATDDTKYGNLKEEVLDLHKQITQNNDDIKSIDTEMSSIKKDIEDVKSTTAGFSDDIKKEVVTARGAWATLDERLSSMDTYKLTYNLENLSLNRTYVYTQDGCVTKESVRGGYNYDVTYTYDSNRNVTKEELNDPSGNLIGYKEYIYDSSFNIIAVNSVNADIISIATNSIVTKELDKRLSNIESLDLIKTANVLNSDTAAAVVKSIQDISARVELLEVMLPNNITNIADIPYIMDKLTELQNKLDRNFSIYEFEVFSGKDTYDVPNTVNEKTSVILEGLTLNYSEDYDLSNGHIIFKIPLIDNFTVVCKY